MPFSSGHRTRIEGLSVIDRQVTIQAGNRGEVLPGPGAHGRPTSTLEGTPAVAAAGRGASSIVPTEPS